MTARACSGRIGAVIVGDEILSGRRQDKHMQQVLKTLAGRGLELSWLSYMGDDQALLAQAYRRIHESADLCFSFGGIGATPDDRTRQAMAIAHDVPLIRHPRAADEIEQRYGAEAYPKRILMAELPEGSDIIPNPFNRIPGFSMGHIHCMPGFPEMAWPMMSWVLDNLYADLRAEKPVQLSLIIEDVRESELIEPMEQLQDSHVDVKVSSLPRFLEGGGYRVEMGVRGSSQAARQAFRALQNLLEELGIVFRISDSD